MAGALARLSLIVADSEHDDIGGGSDGERGGNVVAAHASDGAAAGVRGLTARVGVLNGGEDSWDARVVVALREKDRAWTVRRERQKLIGHGQSEGRAVRS